MADNPNTGEDFSSYQRTVVLRDWWLIKCSNEFEGKRFGVAGTQITETGAVRVFTSSPIIKAFDVFTLEASDGVCIILRGFLNKQRLVQSGFLPQISREFIFGFPPCWESICNHCFIGLLPSAPPPFHKASRTVLSPCNNAQLNLEVSPSLVEKNTEEVNDKDGATARKKSHAKRKLDVSEVQKHPTTNDVGPCVSKAKGNGVERDECMDNEEISGCGKMHSGTNSKKITSTKNATKESLTSEQRKGKLKVTKKTDRKSKKKILKGDMDVVEPMTHPRSKVKDNLSVRKTIRKIDFDEEVTPEKDGKKQKKKTNAVSADSLGQKRSRSGRVLVSPLEFWRNQVPVYDKARNLIQVCEGHQQTNSTPPSKGSVSRKPSR